MREASGVAGNVVSLPGGGGGVSPLGDRFQPDLVRGTGNYGVPLHLPKGPNEQQPQLTLTYSTGNGNGPFGLGWRLNPVRIERRTDRGVPRYTDPGAEPGSDPEPDEFVLGGAGLLVPVGGGRYRAEADTSGAWIEFRDGHWLVRDGSGGTLRFGTGPETREGPAGEVFAWCLAEEQDPAGNTVSYEYAEDGGVRYLTGLRYAIFALRIDYQDRPDVIRNGRAGFLRTIRRRATAIELHLQRPEPARIRHYQLSYQPGHNGVSLLTGIQLVAGDGDARVAMPPLHFGYSTLDASAWRVDTATGAIPPPPVGEAGVQFVDLDGDALPDVLSLSGGTGLRWRNAGDGRFDGPHPVRDLPAVASLDRQNVALADLDGDGRVDLFAVDQPLQLMFRANGRGRFATEPVVFAGRPATRLASPDTRLLDLDGDGVVDLLTTTPTHQVWHRHRPGVGYEPPRAVPRRRDLAAFPDVGLDEPGVAVADMTGDGLPDLVVVRGRYVAYWPNLGHGRWGARVVMDPPPALPAGYRDERLHLVDIDGSGCADVVYADQDRVRVWFNRQGTGFTAPVELPVGVPPDRPVQPADVFGDGRPGLSWSATGPAGGWLRCLRFAPGQAPYLLTSVDNGMGGRFEVHYATSTAMRLADERAGRPWSGALPMVVHVVSRLVERDTVTGRRSAREMRYHDGVYDGTQREFRGFREVTVDSAGDPSVPDNRQVVHHATGDPDEPDPAARDRQRALAGAVEATESYERVDGDWLLRQRSHQTWQVRVVHDDGARRVYFPHLARIETVQIGQTDADLVDVVEIADFDDRGNPGRRVRTSHRAGAPDGAEAVRSEERFSYTGDQARWLVKLPVRMTYLDGAGVPYAVQIRHYDGAPFEGLPEGGVTAGLVTRVLEARLLDARTPAGYLAGRDPAALGFVRAGEGPAAGWYTTSFAVARDGHGNLLRQRGPTGGELVFRYDADGVYPVATTDPLGHETRLVFAPHAGEPAEISYPDGRTARHTHDPLGRLVAVHETAEDTAGLALTGCWFVGDGAPLAITSVAPRTAGRQRAEFAGADLAAVTGASTSRQFYDGFGQEAVQVTRAADAPDGSRRFAVTGRTRVNPRGLVSARWPAELVADPAAVAPGEPAGDPVEQTRYDADGNVADLLAPGGARFRYDRDTFSLRLYQGTAAGPFHPDAGTGAPPPPGPVTRIDRFDARGRLVGIDESGDGTDVATRYRLTVDGRPEAVLDSAGAVQVGYAFAGPGEPVAISHVDLGTRTYYHDAADRLVERHEPDGLVLRFSYDLAGRLTRIDRVEPDGSTVPVRVLHHDQDPGAAGSGRFLPGRVALIEEGDAAIRFSYTPGGHVTREEYTLDGETLGLGREYDLQGGLTRITYPDGATVDYRLDDAGAVAEVPGFVSDPSYDAEGRLTGYRQGNGVLVELPRDPVTGRLSAIRASRDGTVLRALEYGFDEVGAVASILDRTADDIEHQQFAYDHRYRLAGYVRRAGGPTGGVRQQGGYQYDARGNLLSLRERGLVSLDYDDHAHPGRVTGFAAGGGSHQLAYHARGHLRQLGDLTEIGYDDLDRAVRFVRADGLEVRCRFDHKNRRLLKEVHDGGTHTRVRYVTGLFEQHAGHRLRHVYLGDRAVATERVEAGGGPPAALFVLANPLGSLLLATDGAGAVVSSQRVSPFGLSWSGTGTAERFIGRAADAETGLVHLGARFYAPQLGRFISADWYPIENPRKAALLPQGFHVYAYALNNPVAFSDPSGLFVFFALGVLAAVLYIAAVATAVAFAVGFVAGLVYGLATGQGWGSLLTALETALTTTVGMWLGAVTGFIVAGPVGAVVGGLMGGMNGLVSGMTGIYDWTSLAGWGAFLSDSTWGLVGTSLGNLVHIINIFWPDSNYRTDLSHRQNRHVYEGGMRLKNDFAFTMGNVISNAGQGGKGINASFIAQHEELHVWQSRIFGPLFQLTYVVWGIGGVIVGFAVWLTDTDESLGSLIETAAYYDNPFEYWAYKNDSNWPPSGANPKLTW